MEENGRERKGRGKLSDKPKEHLRTRVGKKVTDSLVHYSSQPQKTNIFIYLAISYLHVFLYNIDFYTLSMDCKITVQPENNKYLYIKCCMW